MRRKHTLWACSLFPRLEKCSAHWIRTARLTKHFYWRKSGFRVDLWNASLWSFATLQNILSFCVSFWQRIWLQNPVENFLCVVRIRSEYVKHFTGSQKCSALWIKIVWLTKHFLLKEKWLSSGFFKFKSLELCQTSEYSIILCEIWRRLWLRTPVENFLCVVRRRSEFV